MKPIVIFKKEKEGKVIFTKEEFENLVTQIYETGYEDGRKSCVYWKYSSTPNWSTIPMTPCEGTPTAPSWRPIITCSDGDIGSFSASIGEKDSKINLK